MDRIIERHARHRILEALGDTRVVVILGARQVGKSTLALEIVGNDFPSTVIKSR